VASLPGVLGERKRRGGITERGAGVRGRRRAEGEREGGGEGGEGGVENGRGS